MEDCYKELRVAICGTSSELKRFRQLLVNAVLATDLADKGRLLLGPTRPCARDSYLTLCCLELKELRNSRWDKAFSDTEKESSEAPCKAATDRKATIVIEHLIQVRA
jgi:hypothetical protein